MNTRPIFALLVLLFFAVMMTGVGCASNSRTVHGRVIAGKAGVVTLVDAKDPRLDKPGIGGVLVRIMRPGSSVTPMAEATAGSDGSFLLKLTERQAMAGRVEVVASGADILTCRGSVYVPGDGRRLLILAEPRHGTAAEGRAR